jgi:menaquinone-9 beta-reductase
MRRKDPLIIGGGPAGSAAAIMLARSGAKPLILERQRETGDAICGGFLSWRTLATLEQLGISADAVGGHPVTRVMVSTVDRCAEAPLPGGAVGVSRRHLDTLLLKTAEAQGAGVERGITVREVGPNHLLRLGDGGEIDSETLFLATGKHDLRGISRPKGTTVGLRVRLAPHPTLSHMVNDRIELHLFAGGYAGLMLQEDGSANLCMAVSKDRLKEAGGDPASLFRAIGSENQSLGARLSYWQASDAIDAIAAVPYGWRGGETTHGLFKLGDQAAVIPSLAGEGNGIALASGMAAADKWLRGGPGAAIGFQNDLAKRTARPVNTARLLWRGGEQPALAGVATSILSVLPVLARTLAHMTRIPH